MLRCNRRSVVDGFALGGKGVEQRHIGDPQAAVVGGVFAQCEFSVQLLLRQAIVRGGSFKPAIFVYFAIGALGEGFAVFGSLPLAKIALPVVLWSRDHRSHASFRGR